MVCKHDQEMLMGVADGIVCRACGEHFDTVEDVIKARGEKPTEAQEKPKRRARKKATE